MENKYNLFKIENIIKVLKEKKISNDYILFEMDVPKIENNLTISINDGQTLPEIINVDYFLTYGVLHEFLQEYNKINKNTFIYFTQNILERKEYKLEQIAKIIANDKNINYNNFKLFDYGHQNFFILDIMNSKFTKGNDIKNITYCYNNGQIYMNLLEIFLCDKLKQSNVFLIKFPSIISKSVIDILHLLSAIFDNVILFKSVFDSHFKDSFHVFCNGIDLNKYNHFKEQILADLEKKKIKNLKKRQLKQVLNYGYNNLYNFNNCIKEFSLYLEIVIFAFLSKLQKSISLDKKIAYRNNENWLELDYYNSYIQS